MTRATSTDADLAAGLIVDVLTRKAMGFSDLVLGQNPVPLVNKIAGKWMFIPLKSIIRGFDTYPPGKIVIPPCFRPISSGEKEEAMDP